MKIEQKNRTPRTTLWTYGLVLACSVAAAGCGNHKPSHKGPAVSYFPVWELGSAELFHTVQTNEKAQDGRAFSAAGSNTAASDVTTWTDATSRTQIVTYVDGAGDLYVSYSVGDGVYSEPVSIRPQRVASGTPQVEGVLFLNTAGHADLDARHRHGDAILLFRDDDPGDLSLASPDETTRLYSSYFDRSLLQLPVHRERDEVSGLELEFQYGWQVVALPVDDDPDDRDLGSARMDVSLAGFVSDSTHRSHAGTASSSGDETSFVYAVWSQARPAHNDEQRLQYKRFALENQGFSFPTGTPQVTAIEAPSPWTAHDGLLLTQENTDLVAAVFSTDSGPSIQPVQSALAGGVPAPGNLYGPDHGMAHWAFVFTAAEKAQLGTVVGTSPRVTALSPQSAQPRVIQKLESRMVRDGTWIAASWTEGNELLASAIDSSQATSPASGSVQLTTITGAFDYAFQTELDYRCGVQSDSGRVNWIFQDDDDLSVVGLRAGLNGGSPQATIVGQSPVSTFAFAGPLADRAVCYDRGDADGNANVVFLATRDPQLQNGGLRLFHYSGSSVDVSLGGNQISATNQRGQQEALGSLSVRTTPRTPNIVHMPNYAGTFAHILFTEQRQGTGEAILNHVFWDKTQSELSSSSLVSVDTPRDVGAFELLQSGQRLEIYFEQAGHLFFNRWSPGFGLLDKGGLPNPYLIDNDHPEEVNGWAIHGDDDHTRTDCDDGPTAAVFFDKTFGPDGDQRLLVRTRRP